MELIRLWWGVISSFITLILAPLCAYLWKRHKEVETRQKALELGVQALLRDRIVQAYYHYFERGSITLHGVENVNAMYVQYHALGGNGTVTDLAEALRHLPVVDT